MREASQGRQADQGPIGPRLAPSPGILAWLAVRVQRIIDGGEQGTIRHRFELVVG